MVYHCEKNPSHVLILLALGNTVGILCGFRSILLLFLLFCLVLIRCVDAKLPSPRWILLPHYLLPKVFSMAFAVDINMRGIKIPIKIQQRILDQNFFRSGLVSTSQVISSLEVITR